MRILFFFIISIYFLDCAFSAKLVTPAPEKKISGRRILGGQDVGDTRPYMVYLRPTSVNNTLVEQNWLCGGAIIDPQYVLTSAACIEDVVNFYVISGTHKWTPTTETNECINNGKKKAIWKCVQKSYVFDGDSSDNILWLASDIAIVKVEDDFNFRRRIKGCDFVPQMIKYNTENKDLEKPATKASTAGWGSTYYFSDILKYKPTLTRNEKPTLEGANNSHVLQETDIILMKKGPCKQRWPPRYHRLIENHMICGKDAEVGPQCQGDVNCKPLGDPDEDEEKNGRRRENKDNPNRGLSGGFCENDHGGPLVHGYGTTATVIGIISVSQVDRVSRHCYGPYLFTSVYDNKALIQCAIKRTGNPDEDPCIELLRTTGTKVAATTIHWRSHPDGSSMTEDSFNGTIKRIYDEVAI